MTKETKQKIKKISLRSGTGFLAFIAGLAATFFLVPNRVNNIVLDDADFETQSGDDTYLSRFVSKVTKIIDGDETEPINGIVGNINNLTIAFPNNHITTNGYLNFAIRNLNDLDFTLDLDVEYRDSADDLTPNTIDLGVGYTGKTFYLAMKDFMIKSSYNTTIDAFLKVRDLFFNPNVEKDEGLGIKFDLDGIKSRLMSKIDLSSLGGSFNLEGLQMGEESEVEGNLIDCPITLDFDKLLGAEEGAEPNAPATIHIYVDKERISIRKVEINSLKIKDVEINGDISFDIIPDHIVRGLDDPLYEGKQRVTEDKQFVEIINYKPWLDDIFNLLNNRNIGLDLNASIAQKDEGGISSLADVGLKIDLDASKFDFQIPSVIDADLIFGPEDNNTETTKAIKRAMEGQEDSDDNILSTILNNITAGVNIDLSNNGALYSNIDLTYADNNGYLSLNDGVMKASIDTETINYLVGEISELIAPEETKLPKRGEKQEEGLFSFITSSELVTAIKQGKYDGILNVLKTFKTVGNQIQIGLDLSSLGFGDNAEVNLVLDAASEEHKVIDLDISNANLDGIVLDLDLNTRDFSDVKIQQVLSNKENYDKLDFAVGVFDQVKQIIDTKQSGFNIEGKIVGKNQLGTTFSGEGQFDYGNKFGFGKINIYNHKTPGKPEQIDEIHPIKVSFDNTTNDPTINDVRLVYGANEKLKGRLSVSCLQDIINVVMKVVNKKDARFMKFIEPVLQLLYETTIGKIISNKDYLQLTKPEYMKEIRTNNDGTEFNILLSKDLFAEFMDDDIKLSIKLKTEDNVKKLDFIDLSLKLGESLGGKSISLQIGLNDFDSNAVNPVNYSDKFMDFSSLSVLLAFGLDSTELNTYHLSATPRINGILSDLIKFNLDFYIEVNGETTKVYGRITNIPHIPLASNGLAIYTVKTEFVFEPAKSFDATSSDDIGGYFHILRNVTPVLGLKQTYYCSDSSNFLNKIFAYLLGPMLNFNEGTCNLVGNLTDDKEEQTGATKAVYEEMFYDYGFRDVSKPSENKYQWDIAMDLGKLTAVNALKELTASIYGTKKYYNGEEKCYLTEIDANLKIVALITLNITADITLEDPDANKLSWAQAYPSIEKRYNKIIGILKNMTQTKRESFFDAYLNDPFADYSVSLDKSMPF